MSILSAVLHRQEYEKIGLLFLLLCPPSANSILEMLPGDYSSTSRFVKAAFLKWNSQTGDTEEERVSQFFHILGGVEQPRGLTLMEDGNYEITLYSSCCNTDRGIYYYRTYENSEIIGVDMHLENLDGTELIAYPMEIMQEIRIQNTGD